MKTNAKQPRAKAVSKIGKNSDQKAPTEAEAKSANAARQEVLLETARAWRLKHQKAEESELAAAPTAPPLRSDGRRIIWPPYLSPLPGIYDILRMSPEVRLRLFEHRAAELMRTIHGLRRGIFTPLPGRTVGGMVRNAYRRFNHLQHRAMQAGVWTDGRWDDGEEETHLV